MMLNNICTRCFTIGVRMKYNEKTFMSKFLDGELNTGYYHDAGTPEHLSINGKMVD